MVNTLWLRNKKALRIKVRVENVPELHSVCQTQLAKLAVRQLIALLGNGPNLTRILPLH